MSHSNYKRRHSTREKTAKLFKPHYLGRIKYSKYELVNAEIIKSYTRCHIDWKLNIHAGLSNAIVMNETNALPMSRAILSEILNQSKNFDDQMHGQCKKESKNDCLQRDMTPIYRQRNGEESIRKMAAGAFTCSESDWNAPELQFYVTEVAAYGNNDLYTLVLRNLDK